MHELKKNNEELMMLINEWESKLLQLPEDMIRVRRNSQNRSIKQIVGHMVDSASNNTHRIIHLQYQPSPMIFPDYANLGNNDRWISIQNYQEEEWQNLVQLCKYSNTHIIHVINNLNIDKLNNVWITTLNTTVSLKAMIIDYLRHFKLHLSEIDDLINYE
ncbi:DinB family protein [Clostridium sp. BSD9I1]|uniref:DinB family protein n=1 Tax=Clostridium sp. BSD9I1 TaxID=2003589 RepID=UPI0016453EE7|nr:DinB family protein [Clostridium sp. BSD9I1]